MIVRTLSDARGYLEIPTIQMALVIGFLHDFSIRIERTLVVTGILSSFRERMARSS